MGRFGSMDIRGMKKLQQQLEQLQDTDAFFQACAKELAARLLAKVIKRTPVGDYSKEIEVVAKRNSKKHKKGDVYTKRINPNKKYGGTLRRGWISRTEEEAKGKKGSPKTNDVSEYLNGVQIQHTNILQNHITNTKKDDENIVLFTHL